MCLVVMKVSEAAEVALISAIYASGLNQLPHHCGQTLFIKGMVAKQHATTSGLYLSQFSIASWIQWTSLNWMVRE